MENNNRFCILDNISKQFICFFLFSTFFLQAQYNVGGYVKSSSTIAIEKANIVIKNRNSDKTEAFVITDKTGAFTTQLKTGTYILKVSHLGYKTIIRNIEIHSKDIFLETLYLNENKTELDELILKAESSGITQNKDTTFYKIDKFLNGTEENLKDVIKTLPGLDINEKGKITANGKEIDRLLIDGENIYKKQHQLATENIPSKMIQNVQLIQNYSDFETVRTSEKTGISALNISIKESYKNRFTDHAEAGVGYRQKYRVSTSLFNLNKKIKFSATTNNNNLGETSIGIEDYFNLVDNESSIIKDENSKVLFSNIEDIPRFLASGNKALSRKTFFCSMSSVYTPTPKIKIDFYTLFNNATQEEAFSKETQLKSTQNPITILENDTAKEKTYFGISQLKSIFKKNDNAIFCLSSNVTIDITEQNKKIQNISNSATKAIDEDNNPKKIISNNNFSFTKKLNNSVFTTDVFLKYSNKENQVTIFSNGPFLDLTFNNNNYFLRQLFKNQTTESGYKANYSVNFKKSMLDVFSGTSYLNNSLFSNVQNQTGLNNSLHLNTIKNSIGSNFTFKINNRFSYTFGLDYNYISTKYGLLNSDITYFGFKSTLKTIINNNNSGQLSYIYSNTTTTIDNLLQENIIKDYRNQISNEDVKPYNIFPFHQFNFNHFIFKPKSKFSIIFNVTQKFDEKSIDNNTISSANVTILKTRVVDKNQTTSSFLFMNKELNSLPLSFSSSISYKSSEINCFLNNIQNKFSTNEFSGIFDIKSRFKDAPIHFNVNYKYSNERFSNNGSASQLVVNQLSLNLNGNISKNLYWRMIISQTNYNTFNNVRSIFSLSPKLRYSDNKSNWEYNLTGNNVLNIKNQTIIENNSNSSYFEQRITSILSGYISIGAKYKF